MQNFSKVGIPPVGSSGRQNLCTGNGSRRDGLEFYAAALCEAVAARQRRDFVLSRLLAHFL